MCITRMDLPIFRISGEEILMNQRFAMGERTLRKLVIECTRRMISVLDYDIEIRLVPKES